MSLVTYENINEHIGKITLNRPSVANALSISLLHELNDVIDTINQDEQVRSVIITGSGEKAFCAGADLKERKEMSENDVIRTVQLIGQTIGRVESIAVPVIAALNGVAFGGGLELALACDIRIASQDVKIGLTETALAIIPGAGGTQRLPRLIGIGPAKRLINTAKPINATKAYELGIFEEVVSRDSLLSTAIDIAKQIALNGPVALKQAKNEKNKGMEVDLQTGLEIKHLCYKATIHTIHSIKGLRALNEKRKPQYECKNSEVSHVLHRKSTKRARKNKARWERKISSCK